MAEPTSPELRDRFRNALPECFRAQFDEDVAFFADERGDTRRCGVLMALGWSFDRLIAAAERAAIGRVLAQVEDLLSEIAPEDWNSPGCGLINDIAVCFFESVLPTTPAGQSMVVPQMGPLTRKCVEPEWLRPDPNATLAS
jgi:hypothetical protein